MRQLTKVLLVLPVLLALTAWGGCTSNPVKTANQATADNKADTMALAIYGTFVIAEESVADIVELPAIPAEVKAPLKDADRVVSPVMESIHDTAVTIQDARELARAGCPEGESGTPACAAVESLPAKLAKLNGLLTEAGPKLQKFNEAYKKAKQAVPAEVKP